MVVCVRLHLKTERFEAATRRHQIRNADNDVIESIFSGHKRAFTARRQDS